jgi:SMI1-KNR4 cell-wall
MAIKVSDSYGNPSPASIERLEQALGSALPSAYREFLVRYNGGRPSYELFQIQPLPETIENIATSSLLHFLYAFIESKTHADLFHNFEVWQGRIPAQTLPIGQDQGGSLLLLAYEGSKAGKILYWDKNYEVDFENGVVADIF